MVLKTTGLNSRFQRKTRFWKICTESQDIKQNVQKIGSPNQTCIFLDVLANISGPGEYFSKPIFALKPQAQAGRFEYHEPYKLNKFFLSNQGSFRILKRKITQLEFYFENTIFFNWPLFYIYSTIIIHISTFQNVIFSFFSPPYCLKQGQKDLKIIII